MTTPAASQEVAVPHQLQIAGLTATQHAIGTAYAYRLRGSGDARPVGDGAGGRGVCRLYGFDPRDGATS